MNRIHELALVFAMAMVLIHATRESMRSDVIAESNVTLTKLLDKQMTMNQSKPTELEAVIEAMLHQTPRAADSLRMVLLK